MRRQTQMRRWGQMRMQGQIRIRRQGQIRMKRWGQMMRSDLRIADCIPCHLGPISWNRERKLYLELRGFSGIDEWKKL